jgi:hypothetical protein
VSELPVQQGRKVWRSRSRTALDEVKSASLIGRVGSSCWGNITPDGKADCLVTLKNGDQGAFWDNELMWPYYKAWLRRKDKEDQKPKTQILAATYGHVSEVPIGA